MTEPSSIDALARRLILGIQDELKAAHTIPRLDLELVSALYLRTREALARGTPQDAGAIDELALTIYLTISAWQTPGDLPVSMLSSLRRHIATVLQSTQVERSNT